MDSNNMNPVVTTKFSKGCVMSMLLLPKMSKMPACNMTYSESKPRIDGVRIGFWVMVWNTNDEQAIATEASKIARIFGVRVERKYA